MLPFDLHVLGMPPAFNLSQDQTLHLKILSFNKESESKGPLLDSWSLGLHAQRHSTRVPTQITCQTFKQRSCRKGPEKGAEV